MATCSYDKTINIYKQLDGEWSRAHTVYLPSNPEAIIFLPDSTHLVYAARDDHQIHYVSLDSADFATYAVNLNERQDAHVSFSMCVYFDDELEVD